MLSIAVIKHIFIHLYTYKQMNEEHILDIMQNEYF